MGHDDIQADSEGDELDEEDEEEIEEAELGCWVHKDTREPLGGSTGHIDFTVIG